jgi:pantoate--beta-alanine ligase
MNIVSSISDLRSEVARARGAGRRIAFAPTMGNLHAGHLRLIEVARQRAECVIASIYVNPLQFGPTEDFSAYPRTPEQDLQALAGAGTDAVFMPTTDEIYPRGMAAQTCVEVPGLSNVLCGAFRPGHFRGVTTVVNRLFNLVQPDVAVFGKKDYQQLLLIRLMVADLGLPIEIVGVDTVREPDGLAMSSRNNYLRPEERTLAPRLYAVLCDLRDEIRRLRRIPDKAEATGMERLQRMGLRAEHVSIVRQQDLAPATPQDRQLAVLAAAWLGRTRLIDNVEVAIDG